jgi:O-antigen/teichoic acid export membrane protein
MAVGLATSVYLDALRASLLFTRAAAVEIGSLLLYLAGMLALIAAGAPLWLLIGASAAIPLASGIGCALIVRARRLPYRFQRAAVTRERVTRLLPTAGYLLVIELSSLLISGLDRIIVGAFRAPAAVGLYEGPIRAHNLFWSLNGALAVTVLPATSRYAGEGDRARVRALAVRGSRYTLALLVPLAVTLMALAAPILEVWLGARFRAGATALTILVSYWLLYGAVLVTPGFLVGVGRERAVAGYMSVIALANLGLSVALTPLVGLAGPALGTAIPYVVAFPFVLRIALSAAGVPLGQLARQAWLPAYSLGACLAAALVGLRLAVPLDTLPALLLAAGAGLALYWAAFFALWLRRDERTLMLSLVRGAAPRRAAA